MKGKYLTILTVLGFIFFFAMGFEGSQGFLWGALQMSKIHPITMGEFNKLGVDENNKLYWNEKPVITEQQITLDWWVNLAIILGGLSTLGLFVIESLKIWGLVPMGKK